MTMMPPSEVDAPEPTLWLPQAPRSAKWLLRAWVVVLLSGVVFLFVWFWWRGLYNSVPVLTGVGVVLLLNCVLLVIRAKKLIALDKKVEKFRGALCLRCHTPIHGEGEAGVCPNCGEPFRLKAVKEAWHNYPP